MKREINILHLSDLHIKDETTNGQNVISNSLNNLISDITKNTKSYNDLVIVVSGDIIDKAEYAKNEDSAIKFFELLKKNLSPQVKGLILVPGNHDIERGDDDCHIRKNIEQSKSTDTKEVVLCGYDRYINFSNKIRKLYGFDQQSSTYGTEVVQYNGLTIAFQRIDTAWGALPKSDKGDIFVGNFQIDDIEKQYKNKEAEEDLSVKRFDLTIAVSHYPLSWINANDSNELINHMMDPMFLNTDILLCGHIHGAEVLNYTNHEHSLITLVTGIGWGAKRPTDAKDQHRYSIYQVNIPKNVCEIVMRKTQNNREFDYDYTAYTQEVEKKEKKIVYPLKSKGQPPFLKQNSYSKVNTNNIQLSSEILDLIHSSSMSIARFRESCSLLLDVYKKNFLKQFEQIPDVQKELSLVARINDFLNEETELDESTLALWKKCCNSPQAKDSFESYLRDLCTKFISEFEDIFPKDTTLRAHFRKHEPHECNYSMICEDHSGKIPLPAKVVPWGGLIQSSYKAKKSLIYTANYDLNNIETNWDDFMTLIPNFEGNETELRIGKGRNKTLEKRPIISFGVSIKSDNEINKGTLILSIISFLQIEKHISYFMDEYVRMFYLSLKNIY